MKFFLYKTSPVGEGLVQDINLIVIASCRLPQVPDTMREYGAIFTLCGEWPLTLWWLRTLRGDEAQHVCLTRRGHPV